MKYVIKGFLYNLMLIFIFFGVYFYFKDDLTLDSSYTRYIPPNTTDIFFLATTIQSGVGYSLVYPMTHLTKVIMTIQQILMISSNLLILYLFTL
jgi:hypothetical protein